MGLGFRVEVTIIWVWVSSYHTMGIIRVEVAVILYVVNNRVQTLL